MYTNTHLTLKASNGFDKVSHIARKLMLPILLMMLPCILATGDETSAEKKAARIALGLYSTWTPEIMSKADKERKAAIEQKQKFFSQTEAKTAEITPDVHALISKFDTPGNQEEGPHYNADTQGELKEVRDLKKTETHGKNNTLDLKNLTAQKDKKLAQIKTLGNSAADAKKERELFKEIKELRMQIKQYDEYDLGKQCGYKSTGMKKLSSPCPAPKSCGKKGWCCTKEKTKSGWLCKTEERHCKKWHRRCSHCPLSPEQAKFLDEEYGGTLHQQVRRLPQSENSELIEQLKEHQRQAANGRRRLSNQRTMYRLLDEMRSFN